MSLDESGAEADAKEVETILSKLKELAEEAETENGEKLTDDAEGASADTKKKKKNKKSKGSKGADEDANEDDGEEETQMSSQEQLLQMLRPTRICEESRRSTERAHLFWDTQPVPRIGSDSFQAADSGPIDPIKTPEDIRDEPYALPDAFEWCACDVMNDDEAEEIYLLLNENYVEDDDSMFRFDYSIPFLRWALTPPGYLKTLHLGVRVKASHKLVGFITGIPAKIQVHEQSVNMVEINFLCVHKKLRSKRLAPVLIKEITRRVNKQNVWQAVYTAGVVLPRPVSECRYYHRSLNPKKLIDVGFSHLGPRMTMARTIKLYKVPDTPQLSGMRAMEPKDSARVFELVSGYLTKFNLHPEFAEDELAHWMLPRKEVIYSYVRENSSGTVTDVVSFYSLPSSILNNEKYNLLKAAYSYWTVATTVPLHELMYDGLIFARSHEFDVFNALNVMENESFLKELKFGIGDGFLQYYLYNWKCPKIEPSGMGLVLL
jgi:glycylpeptide N-tetradecanoyltransferase